MKHQQRGFGQVSAKLWVALAVQLLALPGRAQEATNSQPDDAVAAKSGLVLERVTVTAEKRGERLSRVPAAVSAISGAALEKLGANGLGDVAALVPGLSFTGGGQGAGTVTMRGVNVGAEPSPLVSVVVDGIPNGSSSSFALGGLTQLDVGLWDLERLEVLKGPQGTLYGASSMGGLLSYVTREPDLKATELDTEIGAGSFAGRGSTRTAKGTVNLPIMPGKLGLRVAVTGQRDGGWLDNPRLGATSVNGLTQHSARVSLGAAPSQGLKLRLTGYDQQTDRDSSDTVLVSRQDGQPVFASRGQGLWHPEPSRIRFRQLALQADYRLPFANLVSVTSKAMTNLDSSSDYTPSPLGSVGALFGAASTTADVVLDVEKWVQELRLVSRDGPGVQWQLGLFYTKEQAQQRQRIVGRLGDASELPPLNPLLETRPQDSSYDERSGFGSITFEVAPKLDATLGVRRTTIDQTFRLGISAPVLGVVVEPGQATSSENKTTYLANARYRLDDERMFYVRAASGYRPGGPNVTLGGAPATFKADSLWNYEFGYKARAWDGRLDLSASLFRIDWLDLQIIGSDRGLTYRDNGGRARSQGAELSATILATPNWRTGFSAAYTDAHLRSDVASFGGRDGDRMPNSPRWTGAVTSEYVRPVSDAMDARFALAVRHVGGRTSSFPASTTAPDYVLPSYTLTDIRVSLTSEYWSLTASVQNLTNATAQVSANTVATAASPYALVTLARPRTLGLTLRLSY